MKYLYTALFSICLSAFSGFTVAQQSHDLNDGFHIFNTDTLIHSCSSATLSPAQRNFQDNFAALEHCISFLDPEMFEYFKWIGPNIIGEPDVTYETWLSFENNIPYVNFRNFHTKDGFGQVEIESLFSAGASYGPIDISRINVTLTTGDRVTFEYRRHSWTRWVSVNSASTRCVSTQLTELHTPSSCSKGSHY